MTILSGLGLSLRLIAGAWAASVAVAYAAETVTRPTFKQSECVGYYTVELNGEFSYAMANRFEPTLTDFGDGLGAWGSEIRLDLTGIDKQELFLSSITGAEQIQTLLNKKNGEQQRAIDELNSKISSTDRPGLREIYKSNLERIKLFHRLQDNDAIARLDDEKFSFYAFVNHHIMSTELKSRGTPEKTLNEFLSHYRPRALGEIPSGPGVCVPFGFFVGEKNPATIGLNIRLKNQPDIVVFLLARDAATDPAESSTELFEGLHPRATFYGARQVTPIDKFKPLKAITIDGHAGLGSFVRVTREAVSDSRQAFNNANENDEDWGYFAYIPGVKGGKPGASFNLTFKVERFGRFETRRMSESEFRDLTLRIAASVKRRTGAWNLN